MQDPNQAFRARFTQTLKLAKLTQHGLAALAGLSETSIKKVKRGIMSDLTKTLLVEAFNKALTKAGQPVITADWLFEHWTASTELRPTNAAMLSTGIPAASNSATMSVAERALLRHWEKQPAHDILDAVNERRCGLLIDWSPNGKLHNEIEIKHINQPSTNYEATMPKQVIEAVAAWGAKPENQDPDDGENFHNLSSEPWGLQVRWERILYPGTHRRTPQKIIFRTSPMKYLYYNAVHWNIRGAELMSLFESTLEDSLNWVKKGTPPKLPCNVTLHVLAITADQPRRVITRLRNSEFTELHRDTWEATLGEFFHGPAYPLVEEGTGRLLLGDFKYRHFDGNQGRMDWYLTRSIAEEFKFEEARPEEFSVMGLAIEYIKMAPALLAIWRSRHTYDQITKIWYDAEDRASQVDHFAFTRDGFIEALFSQEREWTPLSKLMPILAMIQEDPASRAQILADLKRMYKTFVKKFGREV